MIEVVNFKDLSPEIKKDLSSLTKIRVYPQYQYIGRYNCGYRLKQSPLANPFKLNYVRTRESVFEEYKAWIYARILDVMDHNGIQEELDRLSITHAAHGELYIVCWCVPKTCHGDIIKELLEEQ